MRTGALFLGVLLMASCPTARSEEGLQPYPANPFYWSYRGEPILLIGGSDEDNLFNDPELFRANLRVYEEIGANYFRCTLSWRDPNNVPPYLPDERGRYDLNRFHPEFWERLETFLQETARRDIFVQIELWATFDYYREHWEKNPFNPKNNLNYTAEESGLPESWSGHPAQGAQPFFRTVPEAEHNRVVLPYQEAFARRVLEIALQYPNVLFCIDNETMAPEAWAVYWAEFIHRAAESLGRRAMVTEMWDPWDLRHEVQQRTLRHPDLFTYVEVSQNNWQEGEVHYNRLLWMRKQIQQIGPRPMNNVKVYARLSGGRPNDPMVGWDRWWQNLFAGCAATRFHRPPSGSGADELAQTAIRSARAFFAVFPPFDAEPRPELLADREENEAYVLAKEDAFGLYFFRGGEVRLQVGPAERATVRWFNGTTGAFREPEEVPVEDEFVRLSSPDRSKTWLALVEVQRKG
ncbi:MAG: hypothetical protein KatS3mg115_1499 [Candidatus Poribacteria bacterium]|nr:MAG: hypothetical protein KatS3mg115_1499 [Candidatus Poribacteria bacterium]